jgi:hypothetical protein
MREKHTTTQNTTLFVGLCLWLGSTAVLLHHQDMATLLMQGAGEEGGGKAKRKER